MLDSPGAIVQSGRTISLDPKICRSDVGALRRLLATAPTTLEGARAAPGLMQEQAACVLDLYRGPFLPALDLPWALEARERLRVQVARFIRTAAQQLDRAGDSASARELVRRGMENDPGLRLRIR